MKIKNEKLGDFKLKDMLKDILSVVEYKGDYQKDRDALIRKINFYIKNIK